MSPDVDHLVQIPLDVLVSFHYFRTADRDMATLITGGRYSIIGDSGAYSALTQGKPIKMNEYVAWCRQWSAGLCWTAALDVIGDPQVTMRNWRYMRDRVGLNTVPTLHVGSDPAWMDHYAREGVDFMGLGGMVGRQPQSFPWLVKVFRYARDKHPQMRFHLWGMTHRKILEALPAYSADSSGAIGVGYRFAELRLFDPAIHRHRRCFMGAKYKRGTHRGPYGMGPLLRDFYHVTPQQMEVPDRAVTIKLHARSTQLYAQWLARRHQVTPPLWCVQVPKHMSGEIPMGMRVHVVDTAARMYLDAFPPVVEVNP